MVHPDVLMMRPHKGFYWIFILLRNIIGPITPIVLIFVMYKMFKDKNNSQEKKLETPMERLQMRLVKGEISKEEYEELRDLIEEKNLESKGK